MGGKEQSCKSEPVRSTIDGTVAVHQKETMTPDPLLSFRLDERVAVVTGASSGLGARFSRVLTAAGARVVLVARRGDRLAELERELPGAIAIEADVAAADTAERVVGTALERFGRVDVLVNNAGIQNAIPALDASIDDFRQILEVNLVGAFALAQHAARSMIDSERGGSIVNVSSILGLVGVGQLPNAAYIASKSGLVGLTRELAAQWARRGVRVNSLAPGWFETEMTVDSMFGDERAHHWIKSRTPMGRGGAAHELDGALLFLSSDASSFVTGVTLPVDGGWTAV